MGGLSCYTMCTSPKHAARAAQALRRWERTPHTTRQETVHRPVPTRKSLASESMTFVGRLPCGIWWWMAFGFRSVAYFVTSRVSDSRTAIGPQPNVTLAGAPPHVHPTCASSPRLECTATYCKHTHNRRPSRGDINRKKDTPVKGLQHSCARARWWGLEGLAPERSGVRFLFTCERGWTSQSSASSLVESNLVDSASSHTLVSKIKPCMSKYKQLYTVKLRMAH